MVIVLFIGSAVYAAVGTPTAQTRLDILNSIVHPVKFHWRYKTGDTPGAESPTFNDSSWKSRDDDWFDWGEDGFCWIRTSIKIPAMVGGMSISGSRITFKCGIDDDGIIYVNGKEAQKFHWDQGSVVLAQSAKPGETFSIAIKGINTMASGRLMFAELEFSNLSSVMGEVNTFLTAYDRAKGLCNAAGKVKSTPYVEIMTQAAEQVDTDALLAGNKDAFITSLKKSEDNIKRVDELLKDVTVYMVAHAHIDMNWLWEWPETISIFKHDFATMTNFMEQYPGFIFSQSQAQAYLSTQENAPETFAKMKEMAKRGQWDPSTATCWVEGDLNMPSGEAIARSILYAKRYIMSEFGIEPTVCWEPDTFGHAWTIPQILVKSGVKYYYFMRQGPGQPLFWWQAPDGSKVLAYNFYEYWGRVSENQTAERALEFASKTGVPAYMHIYGVGDHGGGPSKQMIDTIIDLEHKDNYANVKFSKASDYFESALKLKQDYPVVNAELNPIFQGCYTSHADVKRWNRECENILAPAETFAAIATNCKFAYPTRDFVNSWRKTCFNQFHDLMDGTAIHSSYVYSGKLHDEVMAQAKQTIDASLSALDKQIKTIGKGVPVVVFNRLSWPRTDTVSVASPFSGGSEYAKVVDDAGKSYPAQIINGKLYFTARNVPATGYRVFWVSQVNAPVTAAIRADGTMLENQFFRIQINPTSGAISSIYDKLNQREVLAPGGSASLLQILTEGPEGGNAWNFTQIQKTEDINKAAGVTLLDKGPARASITAEYTYDKSKFQQEITLWDGVPRIDIHLKADWQEQWDHNPTPILKVAFQTAVKNGRAFFEIPFGSIERPANGAEVVAQKWIDLSGSNYGVSLLNDCKYGFDINNNVMRATLLRCSNRPDRILDKGMNEMTYSIYPHKGDWKSAGTVRKGYELNEPLIARVETPHTGSLSSSRSYISISQPNLVVTAFKQAEDDNSLILRFYETEGKACNATVTVNMPAKAVVETDMLERPIGKPLQLRNKTFNTAVGKYEIKTYKLIR